MFRILFITLMMFSLLSSKAKAATNIVQKELLEASDKLNGLGKSLCKFLAQELPESYSSTSQGVASINWIQFGNSLNKTETPIKAKELTNSLILLKKTEAGSALFSLLENAGIKSKYMPLTIHVGNISKLVNTNIPMAFNTVIQTKPSSKAIPFMVLNADAYKKNKASQEEVAIVVANELYDVLGRMVAGEAVAATSNYQALGIVLSDIVLNKELSKKAIRSDKAQMIVTYQKALKNYAGDVPPINYNILSTSQKKALDELTRIATTGNFQNFQALNTAQLAVASAQ
jgi:hypothetical protein